MKLADATVERAVETWRRWEAEPSPGSLSIVKIASATFTKTPEGLLDRVDDIPGRVFGAARLAYADAGTLRAEAHDNIEEVLIDDPRLARMEAAADHDEWWEGVVIPDRAAHAVVGADGELEAIGMVETWFGMTGHIGVITRADRRGRGLAGVAAGAAARECLDRDLLPQWRARVGNDASQHVADRLGFVTIGVQIFVRSGPLLSSTMEP